MRPSSAGSGSVAKSQSNGVLYSCENATGMWRPSSLSGGPASTRQTEVSGSSDRRLASTQPAEPAPTIT